MTAEFYKFLGEALNISDFLNDFVEKEGYNNRTGLLKIMLFQNSLVGNHPLEPKASCVGFHKQY